MMEEQADVVHGVQERRRGGPFERISGFVFFRLFNWLSTHPVPFNLLTVRLMTRRYVEGLLQHKERAIYLGGLMVIAGFRQIAVPVAKKATSATTYGLGRKVSILVDAITSFSSKPLIWVFYLGGAIILVSGVSAFYLIIRALTSDFFLVGWPSLIVSIWLLGGADHLRGGPDRHLPIPSVHRGQKPADHRRSCLRARGRGRLMLARF